MKKILERDKDIVLTSPGAVGKSSPVVWVDDDLKELGRFASLNVASDKTGIPYSSVRKNCCHISKKTHGRIFMLASEYDTMTPERKERLYAYIHSKRTFTEEGLRSISESTRIRYDKGGDFGNMKRVRCIEDNLIFRSVSAASDHYKIARSEIAKLARNGKSRNGKHFQYLGRLNPKQDAAPKSRYNRSRAVVAVRPNGEMAGWFESIREAKKRYNLYGNYIIMCCNGKIVHYKGFKWIYKDEYDVLFMTNPDALKWEKPTRELKPTNQKAKFHFSEKGLNSIRASARKERAKGGVLDNRIKIACLTDKLYFDSMAEAAAYYGVCHGGHLGMSIRKGFLIKRKYRMAYYKDLTPEEQSKLTHYVEQSKSEAV